MSILDFGTLSGRPDQQVANSEALVSLWPALVLESILIAAWHASSIRKMQSLGFHVGCSVTGTKTG